MSIFVICDSEERNKLLKDVEAYFQTTDIVCVDECKKLEEFDAPIVISHELVPMLKGFDLSKKDNLIVYYSGNLISVNDENELVALRQQAIDNGEWEKAKRINDILIDINYIGRHEEVSSMPDYLQIESTSYCNANCIMCSHYYSSNKGATHLDNATIENMEDAIQLSHEVSLNGMGEPFVSPCLPEQIDYYASFGNKIVTNTNLSILTTKLIGQISRHFDWLEISCDGATKETYENIRKNLSFDNFKENLRVLKEQCPNVRKHIAAVVMRQNVEEMPLLVELASWAGASIITFMTLNSNIIIGNQKDEMHNYPSVLEYYSVQALKKGEELGIPVIVPNMHILNRHITLDDVKDELTEMKTIPLYKSIGETEQMQKTFSIVNEYLQEYDEIQRDTKASNVKCTGICDWVLKQSYVDLQGNVAMCCRNQSFHTGNVNETRSFSKVWNSYFYRKLRKIFYSGFLPESCLKCGLIESGNLKYLNVDIDENFYRDAEYKNRQKEILSKLLKE